MTIDESIKALKSCSDCDGCLICKRVDDAMQEISRIVSCHDCIYFEPGETERFGWCRNCRCKKHPYGFCDEGLRKEQRDD